MILLNAHIILIDLITLPTPFFRTFADSAKNSEIRRGEK